MNTAMDFADCEVGYDIPALPGMAEADVQTHCLILDLDALSRCRRVERASDAPHWPSTSRESAPRVKSPYNSASFRGRSTA